QHCPRRVGRNETARAQTPQPSRAAETFAQPGRGPRYVVHPAGPRCVAELTLAVAAAQEIDLQYRPTGVRQRPRLQRGHPARLVHLLAERMDVNNPPVFGFSLAWQVK